MTLSREELHEKVLGELRQIGLIDEIESIHSVNQVWGNVIFDRARTDAQETVFSWMEGVGMRREEDDLLPTTDWNKSKVRRPLGQLVLAGRFAQWKYFWTDDCVLRGADIGARLEL